MQSPWWAGDYPITQAYGCTNYAAEGPSYNHPECPYFHDGIDIGMPCGTVIISQINGTVVQVGVGGGGPYALIIRSGNWDFWLLHLEAAYVSQGQQVHPGMALGLSGTMGFSTGCHLHFEVTTAGGGYRASVNPFPFLGAPGGQGQGVPLSPYPPSADSSWKRSGLSDPTGVYRMTRGDIAAFFRFLFMMFQRDPQPVPDDPQQRWEDQYWADHWLDMVQQHGDGQGQFQALMDWFADLRQQAPDLPVPLHIPPAGAQGPPGPPGPVQDLSPYAKLTHTHIMGQAQ